MSMQNNRMWNYDLNLTAVAEADTLSSTYLIDVYTAEFIQNALNVTMTIMETLLLGLVTP